MLVGGGQHSDADVEELSDVVDVVQQNDVDSDSQKAVESDSHETVESDSQETVESDSQKSVESDSRETVEEADGQEDVAVQRSVEAASLASLWPGKTGAEQTGHFPHQN